MNHVFAFVHFDAKSGLIRQLSTSPFPVEGLDVAEVVDREPDKISVVGHKVDLASVNQPDGMQWKVCSLTDIPEAERLVLPIITIDGLRQLRGRELIETDALADPPADRPFDPQTVARWITYRAALRELGTLESAEAWIAAWPIRPDGRDAIAVFRAAMAARKII